MSVPGDQIKLLIHSDGPDGSTTFVDSSSNNVQINYNDSVVHDSAQSKFGATAIRFHGDYDYLYINGLGPEASGFDPWALFGANDFTIDFWVFPDSSSPTNTFFSRLFSASNYPWEIQWQRAYTRLSVVFNTDGTTGSVLTANGSLPADEWSHIAVVRNGSTLTVYVNGTSAGSSSISGSVVDPAGEGTLNIGKDVGEAYYVGYIDEYRIVNGTAAWTSDFTPPTSAYPNPVAVDESNVKVGFLATTDIYSDVADKTYSANVGIGFRPAPIIEVADIRTLQEYSVGFAFTSELEAVANGLEVSGSFGFLSEVDAMTTYAAVDAGIGFGCDVHVRRDAEAELSAVFGFDSTVMARPDVGVEGLNCRLGFGGEIVASNQVDARIGVGIGFAGDVTAGTTQSVELVGGIWFGADINFGWQPGNACILPTIEDNRWC